MLMLQQLINRTKNNENMQQKYNNDEQNIYNQLLQAFLTNDIETINQIFAKENLPKSLRYEEYLSDLQNIILPDEKLVNPDLPFSQFVIRLIRDDMPAAQNKNQAPPDLKANNKKSQKNHL